MSMEIESQPLTGGSTPHQQQEPTGCSTGGIFTFVMGLIAGTFSALLCKMAYDTASEGIDGEPKLFAKPIMMLLLMFAGMVPAGIFWLIQQWCTPPEKRDVVSYSTMAVLIIPSICDLLCTLLLLVAQLYITASLWQMMRGSIIIITALLKRFVLDHRLKLHMWLGVGLITVAMLLVASTSFFTPAAADAGIVTAEDDGSLDSADDYSYSAAAGGGADAGNSTSVSHSDDADAVSAAAAAMLMGSSASGSHVVNTKDPRIGIMLVVLGCLAQGVQYVFEEKVMAVDNAPPLVVIGCEGLWGTLLTLVLVYPLAYIIPGEDNGSFENPYDSWEMLRNNSQLGFLAVAFVLTVTVYNCAAVYVTKYLSAIWHAILDNFRPITIWGMDLALFYFFMPGSGFGEAWVDGSWLQLGGLLILLFGTAVYNGSVVTFSDMDYSMLSTAERLETELKTETVIKTQLSMSSPSITRSPLIYQPTNLDAHPGEYAPSPATQRRQQQQGGMSGGYQSTASGAAVRRSSYDA